MDFINQDEIIRSTRKIKIAIDFFTAQFTNPNEFKEIKKICSANYSAPDKQHIIGYLQLGFLSLEDFSNYVIVKNKIDDGVPIFVIDNVLKILSKHQILKLPPEGFLESNDQTRYQSNGDYAKFMYERNLIFNILGGWGYISRNYSDSVAKIENTNAQGDLGIGTGFYFAEDNNKFSKHFIITNRHVVENASKIKVYLNNNTEISYSNIIIDPKRDLAYIILDEALSLPGIHIYPQPDILAEIITIGYPSIPMTKDAYQVFHKGEVNSFVEDYSGNKFFLFSAKTSSGNSGSPIINKHGMAVGIIAQDFFEEEQFFKKGKPSYYAGIPGIEIIDSMNELIF